jgi:hypothetical protein
MTRPCLAFAIALLAAPAAAQDYNRADLVRGLCQPDGCDEFAILSAERLVSTEEGTLLKTRVKTFHASYGGRKELGEENGHVYCSRTKPAVLAEQNGKALAFFLAPFATEESRESVRRNANFHALYFTICHGAEAGKAAVRDLPAVAGSHGYRVALAQSKLTTLNRAEDILASGDRPAAAARPPEPSTARSPVELAPVEPEPSLTQEPVKTFRAPVETARRERPVEQDRRRSPPPRVVEEEGLMSAPRRLTNRAFDALDDMGEWVLGSGRP